MLDGRHSKMKIALVCSNGGHLIEMINILNAVKGHEYFFITLNGADTEKLKAYKLTKFKNNFLVQLNSFIHALWIFIKERPKVMITTGGSFALMFCYVAKLFRIKIIFIESICRVTTKSWTGRLVYPISDMFIVQWPSLLDKYGKKAIYGGKII